VDHSTEANPLCPLSENERLADVHLVTFVVRLTLDDQGQVVSGELTDTESTMPQRFQGKKGLIRTLLASLELRQNIERAEGPRPNSSIE
jgi:hypothetical protein